MKWIGQNIYDQISRFRDHTFFEDSITLSTGKSITMDEYTSGTISITKVQDSGTEFNNNDTSLLTAGAIAALVTAEDLDVAGDSGIAAVDLNSQSLTVTGGTGITTSATGQAVTINVDASQAGITTVGTIGTGVWNATKILSPKTTHIIHYPFWGYVAGLSSGNFQYAEQIGDPQFPEQHNTDYGNTVIASGNLADVSDWFRGGGTVIPRAVTATRMYGWMTCPGTDDVTIALCKITPTRNSNAAITPIVVATTVIAGIDNDKMDFFNITGSDAGTGTGSIVTSAIAQGDILMPFVISPNTKTTIFNFTLEVEA